MSKRVMPSNAAGEPPEPAIAHHYLLVPIVEVLVIFGLAWLGSRFR
jgi:hypothetical protein